MTDNPQLFRQVQNQALVEQMSKPARQGWAEASQALANSGDDELVMGEFANEEDATIDW